VSTLIFGAVAERVSVFLAMDHAMEAGVARWVNILDGFEEGG
jgi:hypothetical protein